MTIKAFKRYETKYFVTPEQYEIICAQLQNYMLYDEFCVNGDSYMIYNLYFDTENDEIIRHSLDKPYYKEKLRLRSYNMHTSGEDMVFLELKKKISGIVAKRRAYMTYSQAMDFIGTGKIPQTDNYQDRQVVAEIEDFLKRNPVSPKVYISYERVAFFDKDNREFRVSFDKNILTRRTKVNLMDGDYGSELLADDRCLMEIKCAGQLPLWLCHTLSEMKIYRTSFSKYGTEYKRYVAYNNNRQYSPVNRRLNVPVYDNQQILITV